MARTWRQIKFDAIEHTLLPIAILVLKGLARSWRIDKESRAQIDTLLQCERAIVTTFHGMPFPLLRFGSIISGAGRRICVMTSPSRDGRLMERIVKSFGFTAVQGSSRSKAASGSRGMIRATSEGAYGVVSVDGPRGPIAVPKPGFIRIARASNAPVYTIVASARPAIKFGVWDGLFLPLPFARVQLRTAHFEMNLEEGEEAVRDALQRQMAESARSIGSHIMPEAGA